MRCSVGLLTLLIACNGASQPSEPPPTEPNPRHAVLQDALETFDAGSPGVMLAVRAPDYDTFVGAAGWSDVDGGIAMAPEMTFGIASLTKSFTAAVVLQLRDEGALALDDALSLHCESCPFGEKTVEQLLRHRSGLSDVVRLLMETRPAELFQPWPIEDLLALAVDDQQTGFSYSNTNYLLLGLLIESVTQSTWEAEVRARLLAPLALDDTYLPTVDDVPGLRANGYFEALPIMNRIHPSIGWSAGSMVASAEDLLTWLELLTGGEAVSATVLAAMTDSDGDYGRGLYVTSSSLGPDTKIGHDGLAEFTTDAFCVADAGACVVAMANRFEADAAGVAELAWGELLP